MRWRFKSVFRVKIKSRSSLENFNFLRCLAGSRSIFLNKRSEAARTTEKYGNLSIYGLAEISLRFINIDFSPREHFYSRKNDKNISRISRKLNRREIRQWEICQKNLLIYECDLCWFKETFRRMAIHCQEIWLYNVNGFEFSTETPWI